MSTTTAPTVDEFTEDPSKEGILRLTSFGQRHGSAITAILLCILIELFGYLGDIILSAWISDRMGWSMDTKYGALLLGIIPILAMQLVVLFLYLRFWSAVLILVIAQASLALVALLGYALV